MFLCRLFAAAAFAYAFLGIFFHLRSFANNAQALGMSAYSVYISLAFCVFGFLLCCSLVLGYRTRVSSGLLFLSCALAMFVFRGNSFDRMYFSFIIFSAAGVMPIMLLGPGTISLDYKRAVEKEKKYLSR